jgi:hypothetical protein
LRASRGGELWRRKYSKILLLFRAILAAKIPKILIPGEGAELYAPTGGIFLPRRLLTPESFQPT